MPNEIEQWVSELLRLNDADDKVTEKQIQILQAAVEMFAEKGYAATSTSEIAQKAGVAEGTIFRHYRTKKDLLISIVAPVMSKLVGPFVLRDFHKVLDSPYNCYEDFLRAVVVNRLEFARKNAPILKIMMHEIPFHPELQAQFQEHVASKVLDRVRRIITFFQERGEIVDFPPITVLRLSASVVIGYVFTRYFFAPSAEWNEEEEIEHMIHFMMHGLKRTPAPETTPEKA